MAWDVCVLFVMFLCGAALGILFDMRRGIQKAAKIPDLAVIIADVVYWLICAATVAWCIWRFNSGIVRTFEFLGLFGGALIYFLTLSNFVVRFFAFLSCYILKTIAFIFKILLTPAGFLYKIILSIHQNKKERHTDNERNERESGAVCNNA